ncbi:MAG: hypothetical protein N3D74_00890 [Caldisericia bacterium]|nr:hypothetical protein [Caldisericia bacterium]
MKKKFKNFNSIDYLIATSEILQIKDETLDFIFANMYLLHVESISIRLKK